MRYYTSLSRYGMAPLLYSTVWCRCCTIRYGAVFVRYDTVPLFNGTVLLFDCSKILCEGRYCYFLYRVMYSVFTVLWCYGTVCFFLRYGVIRYGMVERTSHEEPL